MFSDVVMCIPKAKFEEILDSVKEENGAKSDTDLTAENLKTVVQRYKALYVVEKGEDFPQDPKMQLIVITSYSIHYTKLYEAFAAMLVFILSRYIVRPVRDISYAAKELSRGNLDWRVTPKTQDEIGELAASFNKMAEELKMQDGLRNRITSYNVCYTKLLRACLQLPEVSVDSFLTHPKTLESHVTKQTRILSLPWEMV